MSPSSSNNVDGDAWLMQMELRRKDAEGATMEEDEGDSLEEQPPTSEKGTLAGISTILNPHQAIWTTNNHEDQEVREGLPPRRPLHRLHRNNFHNLVHNYGVENTHRRHIPSNWDISCPSESDAGKNAWGPENKHIMAEVQRNTEMIQHVLREIQSLKEILINVMKDKHTTSPSPPSPKKET
jgi:hypothetical protein